MCTADVGRGMGTELVPFIGMPFVPLVAARSTIEVDGDEAFDHDRRCVGCEYGSAEDKPIRLSTDIPS